MPIVLKRLEEKLKNDQKHLFSANETIDWSFRYYEQGNSEEKNSFGLSEIKPMEVRENQKRAIFNLLLLEDASLALEYTALCQLIQSRLKEYEDTPNNEKRKEQIISLIQEALNLAIWLDQKYGGLIADRGNLTKNRLEEDQKRYCFWLATMLNEGRLIFLSPIKAKQQVLYADLIQQGTATVNPFRLFFARAWRFLRQLTLVLTSVPYCTWILWANIWIAFGISWAGFLFFMPRLLVNMMTLLSQAMPLAEDDWSSWYARVNAQWTRLWPLVLNDVAWVVNGTLLLFFFVGPLVPLAIFVSFGSALYDVVVTSLQLGLNLNRYYQLVDDYKKIQNHQEIQDSEHITLFLSFLENHIDRENKLLYLALFNFLVILVGISLALPWVIAFCPMLSVVGAGMAVAITFFTLRARAHLQSQGNLDLYEWNKLLPLPTSDSVLPIVVEEPLSDGPKNANLVQRFSSFFICKRESSPVSVIPEKPYVENPRKDSDDFIVGKGTDIELCPITP